MSKSFVAVSIPAPVVVAVVETNASQARVEELEALLRNFARGPGGVSPKGYYENDAMFAGRVVRESRKVLGIR